ncbi:HlyD family secretion protein [Sphingopyxis sp. OAS728]|uniref:HlyD family type I secretion periplasmic adaptor subunit n=1 Tax=Sphingopyxis sp. OAS728 TaxID=2663823 RepID=UPI00178B9835|nr:HlyD family type I secretion periplasmic adaptor subunit [Sphingopyxis sp. OAS728]MBE1527952.1 HlyD family secretion protein [Sphingopyxis sp. OAS728]
MTTLPTLRAGPFEDFGLSSHGKQGKILLLLLALLILGWGLLAQISSAVVAQGTVISRTGAISVEHPVGGRIETILVREGQQVSRGQLLAQLAPTAVTAAADFSETRVRELDAQRLRLLAERDGTRIRSDAGHAPGDPVLRAEVRVFETQRRLEAEKQAQIREQIAQTRSEIAGLQDQIAAGDGQRRLIVGELDAARTLYEKGYATLTRVNSLEREAHRLEGDRGAQRAAIAQGRARIAELEVQALQLRSERQNVVMTDLKETQLQLAQARAQNLTDADARSHLDIRASAAGRVQQLAQRTGGGVLGAGEALLLLIPSRERLIVETRIAPDKIDRISVGQSAKILFPAFASATTPQFAARVTRISPTVQRDERSGVDYYLVACELLPSSHPSIRRLRSGMPAEAHISGGSRSALSYFLKPLIDQIGRLFREP